MDKDLLIKRLAVIKYLYKRGFELSKESEINAGFSLLSFHDSIEMFLLLLAEHKNIRTDKLSLMDYWDKFPDLTLKESIRALKDRRVNIKHKGLFPSKSDIEVSRINASDFFEQNTKTQFGIDFNDVTLFDLVSYKETRLLLIEAQEMMEAGKMEICLEKTAMAFYELMHSYESEKHIPFSDSIFSFGERIHALGRLNSWKFSRSQQPYAHKEVEQIFEKIEKKLEILQEALKINCLGIDYKQYAVFNILTPEAVKLQNGEYFLTSRTNKFIEIKRTKENCQFCIDFVLESSLKLQEFDFNIENYLESKWEI